MRKMNILEKLANMAGPIFRYHAAKFPGRWAMVKQVAIRELAPPTLKDWPAIKSDFNKFSRIFDSGEFKKYTVKEALIYGAVMLEIVFWFFVGEMIGRWHVPGYLVSAEYIYKPSQKKAEALGVGKLQGIDDHSNLVAV